MVHFGIDPNETRAARIERVRAQARARRASFKRQARQARESRARRARRDREARSRADKRENETRKLLRENGIDPREASRFYVYAGAIYERDGGNAEI